MGAKIYYTPCTSDVSLVSELKKHLSTAALKME